jgi:hypothetical protein
MLSTPHAQVTADLVASARQVEWGKHATITPKVVIKKKRNVAGNVEIYRIKSLEEIAAEKQDKLVRGC